MILAVIHEPAGPLSYTIEQDGTVLRSEPFYEMGCWRTRWKPTHPTMLTVEIEALKRAAERPDVDPEVAGQYRFAAKRLLWASTCPKE